MHRDAVQYLYICFSPNSVYWMWVAGCVGFNMTTPSNEIKVCSMN